MPAVLSDPVPDLLRQSDIPAFLALAEEEGWVCDPWEFDFHFARFPQGCRVIRSGAEPVAFVTAIRHERSGWVGNLLVRRGLRGRGLGRMLMAQALAALDDAGVTTVWLTASEDGRPLYETLGFRKIDTVVRWRGGGWNGWPPAGGEYGPRLDEVDEAGWGDRRSDLLRGVVRRGAVHCGADGFLVVQPTGAGLQIGPWGSRCSTEAEALLEKVLGGCGPGAGRIFLDVPGGNPDAARLLGARGFRETGSTVLMYRGAPPDYRAAAIFALASMGSMG
jgi:GNAT superfamily N-acetyltransferase